jgi:hypothetical protein
VIKISTDDSSEDSEDEVEYPDVMKVKVDLDHIVATGPKGALEGSYDEYELFQKYEKYYKKDKSLLFVLINKFIYEVLFI